MSGDIPCNNCGVKFSDVEKLKAKLKEAESLANFTKKYALDHWVGKDLWDEMEKEYKTKYKERK